MEQDSTQSSAEIKTPLPIRLHKQIGLLEDVLYHDSPADPESLVKRISTSLKNIVPHLPEEAVVREKIITFLSRFSDEGEDGVKPSHQSAIKSLWEIQDAFSEAA